MPHVHLPVLVYTRLRPLYFGQSRNSVSPPKKRKIWKIVRMRVRSIEFELPEVILIERPKRMSKLRRKIMNTMRSSPYGGIESKRKVSILPEVGGRRRSKKRKKRMISNTIEDPSTPVITSGKYLKDLLLSSKQDNELVRTWAREIDLKRLRSESSTPEGSSLTLLERKRLASSIVKYEGSVVVLRRKRERMVVRRRSSSYSFVFIIRNIYLCVLFFYDTRTLEDDCCFRRRRCCKNRCDRR